jgi:hypothetical protein
MSPEKVAKRHPHCGVEGHGPAHRFETADAYACLACDVWLEEKCEEPQLCPFCLGRAATPSAASPGWRSPRP